MEFDDSMIDSQGNVVKAWGLFSLEKTQLNESTVQFI